MQPIPPVSDEAAFDALDQKVAAEMERLQVPGVAVGVIHGNTEHVVGFGITNVKHPLPVNADTVFQIGSTTKTITATAMMRLVEMGKLELDAPVRNYLPDLRLLDEWVAAQVTSRHLLTHTSGWVGDYFADTGAGDDALAKMLSSMVDLPQLTPLGTLWSYNNAGFYIAGRVIEVVTGQSYESAVRELVLDPLGMTSSFFFAHEVITERFVVGHFVRDAGPHVALPWALARSAHPVGGLISSVPDQLRYARFHLGDGVSADGTRLLSAESMAQMRTPQVPMNKDAWMGLSWMLRGEDEQRIMAHGGATRGQISAFLLAPAHQFAMTVLTNADHGSELCNTVTTWALQHFLGIVEPEVMHQSMSATELHPYTGTYTAALSDVELQLEDGALMLHVTPKGGFPTKQTPAPPTPPPMRVAFHGEDRIVVLDAPMKDARGEFLRASDGSIAWLRLGGRVRRREPAAG